MVFLRAELVVFLLAKFVVVVMYLCMVFSIAELSAALPHAGGFYSFTRNAFGSTFGFVNGIVDIIEYLITNAVIFTSIAAYMQTIFSFVPLYVWWVVFYAVFIGINVLGTALTCGSARLSRSWPSAFWWSSILAR